MHRIRKRLVEDRTAAACQARAFLLDAGIAVKQGITNIRAQLPHITEDLGNELTILARDYLSDLYGDIVYYDERIEKYNRLLSDIAMNSEVCSRLLKIEGVGVLAATAVFAAAGNGSEFENGRHFAAWLGLVPKQHSTGGKSRLLGISKRGDVNIRTLLIHGARSMMWHWRDKNHKRAAWLRELTERRGSNRAAVALANKNARIIWALISSGENYKKAA